MWLTLAGVAILGGVVLLGTERIVAKIRQVPNDEKPPLMYLGEVAVYLAGVYFNQGLS